MVHASRAVALQLSKTGGPPFNGSVGYVNDRIGAILSARGWDVRNFAVAPVSVPHAQEAMVPLAFATARLRHQRTGRVDLAIHDGAGIAVRTPSRQWAERHLVLYHGLAYGPGAWLGNDAVDLHVANSPYLARSLRALCGLPDWERQTVLDPEGFSRITDIAMPVPCVASPEGDPGFTLGGGVPDSVHRALDSGVILGHALQPSKQDLMATVAVLFWLNDALRSTGQRAMLVISEESLPLSHRQTIDGVLAGTGLTCDALFIPVPLLRQRAVFQLFGLCRFGLAYNLFPEPFGFYVLESVFAGCPVYTNGAGNNRFLLPPGHGIEVIETDAMAPDAAGNTDPSAFKCVADAIVRDLHVGASVRDACASGHARIAATWSLSAFESGLLGAIERAHGPAPETPAFDALRIGYAPFVRGIDRARQRVRSDYGSQVLELHALALIDAIVGRTPDRLDAEERRAVDRFGLFERGVLALNLDPDLPAG